MRVRIPGNSALTKFFLGPVGRVLIMGGAICTILLTAVFIYFYARYSKVIDQKLAAGPFANNARIFAAPESVGVGDAMSPVDIAADLRRSGYSESRGNPTGSYELRANEITIIPGPDSYFDQEAGVIKFTNGRISQIVSLQDNTSRSQYQLEPQLITNLSGASREKRRMVKFADIPTVLVQAVTSAEDKHFFQHSGFDPVRVVKAAYVDLKKGRRAEGASTLSMQLAKNFFLEQDKRWSTKLAEVIITLQLEQKLTKQDIFEDYANQVYLGSRGSFRIHGFGEAAEVFLGKDLSQINIPEAAQLAGTIQNPAVYDPFNHPDHARDRRNIVLTLMHTNGFIGDRDYATALETPLTIAKPTAQSVEAPYFVDLVNNSLQDMFKDTDFQSNAFRVYTTLDLRLQRIAADAISSGMKKVDEIIKHQRRFKGQTPPQPQVALVAIDPHTGLVKAVAGGRNYGMSQLNHVLASRQPGSIFKPFVYAAAIDTGVEGGREVFTPSYEVMDAPTTFWWNGQEYKPHNFEGESTNRMVSLRYALMHSLNIPTVALAEKVGFDSVVAMARRAGLNDRIQPTPAVALGSYDISPFEAVGAYTMFANAGRLEKPDFLELVRDQTGRELYRHKDEGKQVLDSRVAYILTNMMQDVMLHGTAAGARAAAGFDVPAAGKTGTSDRDGWFAGYTSELLCVVWVGFDDSRDLDIEGARSAAPIWMQFMKEALKYREYRDTKAFEAPDGIVSIEIDPDTGFPATPACPTRVTEVYIAGTQPVGACPKHGGRMITTTASGWDTAPDAAPAAPAPPANPADHTLQITGTGGDGQVTAVAHRAANQIPPDASAKPPGATPKKDSKPGLLRRLLNVIK
ncbi:MAG TPA: PBP1A family penicillin-binding protein [Bryobacteraceae bacterium]|jgi:penicillin-binding protein 1B|nr:PBP1A family penicillin-binding protein [Bryobacteraceae bacterium]